MEDKNKLLSDYIKANTVPILVSFKTSKDFDNAVILPSNVDIKELNGHYEGTRFVPPSWYKELIKDAESKILVIDNIDSISKEDQLKFCEILEYRKVSTFGLPKNCAVVITAKEINKDKINKEIMSLVALI